MVGLIRGYAYISKIHTILGRELLSKLQQKSIQCVLSQGKYGKYKDGILQSAEIPNIKINEGLLAGKNNTNKFLNRRIITQLPEDK